MSSGSGYQRDRFDDVKRTSRVGAHRAVERIGSPGAWILVSTLITLILTATGVLIYTLQPGSVSFMDQLRGGGGGLPGVIDRPAEAEIGPDTTVVVLNGTTIDGLAFTVDEAITEEGWGSTVFAGNADENDVQISAVFYADEADEGLARGLGEKLGGISFYQNPNYSTYDNQLTVLIGADYNGPGLAEAQAQATGPDVDEPVAQP